MARKLTPEQMELQALAEQQRELEERSRQQTKEQRRLAQRKMEQGTVMPPLSRVQETNRIREYEFLATRGHLKNQRRQQGRSFLLLVLLTCASASMIWWGLQIMKL